MIFVASMYSSGGMPYQATPASASGAFASASQVSAPPMQKPVTATFALLLPPFAFRNCTAPRTRNSAASSVLPCDLKMTVSPMPQTMMPMFSIDE